MKALAGARSGAVFSSGMGHGGCHACCMSHSHLNAQRHIAHCPAEMEKRFVGVGGGRSSLVTSRGGGSLRERGPHARARINCHAVCVGRARPRGRGKWPLGTHSPQPNPNTFPRGKNEILIGEPKRSGPFQVPHLKQMTGPDAWHCPRHSAVHGTVTPHPHKTPITACRLCSPVGTMDPTCVYCAYFADAWQ